MLPCRLKALEKREETYPELGLVVTGDGKGLVGDDDVGAHLVEGVVGDGQTELLLGLGEPDPELAPGAGTFAGREDGHHLLRGIPRAEGGLRRVWSVIWSGWARFSDSAPETVVWVNCCFFVVDR